MGGGWLYGRLQLAVRFDFDILGLRGIGQSVTSFGVFVGLDGGIFWPSYVGVADRAPRMAPMTLGPHDDIALDVPIMPG